MKLSQRDAGVVELRCRLPAPFAALARAALITLAVSSFVVPSASARVANAALQTDSKTWELTKRSVPELVKLLQIGSSAQKSQAAQALGDKAYAGDTSVKEAIPALLQLMRSMTGGKASEDAAVALAKVGSPAAGFLRDEVTGACKQSTNASRLLAVRALGLIGPEIKELAEPLLIAILEHPRRNLKTRDAMSTEAAIALANLGGPYKPSLVPDIVAAMDACKNPDTQLAIAFQLVELPDSREKCLNDLGQVFIRASSCSGLDPMRRQELLEALVKLNTPASLQAVLFVLSPPQKNMSTSEREAAANALAKLRAPPRQVQESMVKALQAERSPTVIRATLRAFGAFGPAATPVLPHLEAYLKELPQKKNLDNGDKEKASVALALQRTIEQVKATAPPLATTTVAMKTPEAAGAGSRAVETDKSSQDLNAQVLIALEIVSKPNAQGPRVAYLETVLIKALSDPAVAAELRPDIPQGLVRIHTTNSILAVCDVLSAPQKVHDYRTRTAAAKALAEAKPPLPQMIDALVVALKADRSPSVLGSVCKTLVTLGPASEPALQPLKDYLRDLPDKTGLDGGDRDKPNIEKMLQDSISKIRQAVAEDVLNGASLAPN